MTSHDYGTNKKLYTVFEKLDEIEIHVFTEKQDFRRVIANHTTNPSYFLQHQLSYEKSNIAAKKWMAKIVSDYREKFRTRKVTFVLRDFTHNNPSDNHKSETEEIEVADPRKQKNEERQKGIDSAILGIAQAYGPYPFWLENIASLLNRVNPDTIWRTLMVVSALKDKTFINQAISLLKFPDSRVRAWSCHYLAAVRHIEASEKILELSRDPSPRVRTKARKAFITLQPGNQTISYASHYLSPTQFHVLISDDNHKTREKITILLRKKGFITYSACTERETIELALRYRPHVIVTDNQKIGTIDNNYLVDNISGLNMTWDICRLPELRDALLIMLTVDDVEPIFLWQGGDIFLSKMRHGAEMLGIILHSYTI